MFEELFLLKRSNTEQQFYWYVIIVSQSASLGIFFNKKTTLSRFIYLNYLPAFYFDRSFEKKRFEFVNKLFGDIVAGETYFPLFEVRGKKK